jgi:exodeoxyribonuclease V gamma subunit
MTLKVSLVPDLEDIVVSIETFLQSHCVGADPFAAHTVIVPSLGVRSWLTPKLAQRLGAQHGMNDGVLANVNVRYIGHLQTIIRDAAEIKSDAWNRDAVNLATLRALADFPETTRLEKKYNGRLNAVRTLADRFDRYAARRPELILSWDNGVAALGELDASKFEWQFHLWRRVRDIIGESPWPVVKENICAQLRAGHVFPSLPSRLMIAGFENISPTQLDLIDALSTVVDIELIFVHQSPFLAHEWSKITAEVAPNRHELPLADVFVPNSVTPLRLPPAWMKSSFELELLLSAYGVPVSYSDVPTEEPPTSDVLHHVQHTVATGKVTPYTPRNGRDTSVQIHRAHNLSRQVEVLHDALLHAFEEDKDLQPHDVVILCADPEAAAPVLEAVFEKTTKNTSDKFVRLPLVVADRSLREVSDGAELSAHVLHLITSRFDSESFLAVATHPLVARRFQVSPADVSSWLRHLEQSRLRWGLDAEHRQEHGLVALNLTAHSWLESVERSLLGAVMPVGEDPVVVGESVRPLPFIDASETQSLLTLVEILSVLVHLEHSSRFGRTMDSWCAIFTRTLYELCGESCTDLDDVFLLLNQYQRAALQIHEKTDQSSMTDVVPFSQFAEYLNGDLQSTSGRQPLRTGAITATSFIPLRTVPFKVVCVLGYDDGTLPSGESEGDDLIAATPMLGDGDARLESRRILLDALMSARERFIVTCTGRSIKNNNLLPLVTPLAEMLDFFGDCGLVKSSGVDDVSVIEYIHPRHLGSADNFGGGDIDNGVSVPVQPWSFDEIGRTIAETRQKISAKKNAARTPVALLEPLDKITLDDLVRLVLKPLDYYLRNGLGIWRPWVDELEDATLPIAVDSRKLGWACRDLFHAQLDRDEFVSTLHSLDILPVAPFDEEVVEGARALIKAYREKYDAQLHSVPTSVNISLELPGLPVLNGVIDGFHVAEKTLTLVSFEKISDRDIVTTILRLLVLIALGETVEKAMLYHINTNGTGTTPRSITIDSSLTKDVAEKKLASLLSVEPIARAVACPMFGGTTQRWMNFTEDDRMTTEEEFEKFVEDDFKFKKSDELIVYGSSPEFEEVYEDPNGLMKTFFTSYFDVIRVGGKTGKWELSA